MRLRKIISGVLIGSTLALSFPALATPASGMLEGEGMLQGDGGGFDGDHHDNTFTWVLGLTALTLAVVAVVDSSKSP